MLEASLGFDILERDSGVNQGLGDIWIDTSYNALCAEHLGSPDRVNEILRHLRIDQRHTGDINDHHFRLFLGDCLE